MADTTIEATFKYHRSGSALCESTSSFPSRTFFRFALKLFLCLAGIGGASAAGYAIYITINVNPPPPPPPQHTPIIDPPLPVPNPLRNPPVHTQKRHNRPLISQQYSSAQPPPYGPGDH